MTIIVMMVIIIVYDLMIAILGSLRWNSVVCALDDLILPLVNSNELNSSFAWRMSTHATSDRWYVGYINAPTNKTAWIFQFDEVDVFSGPPLFILSISLFVHLSLVLCHHRLQCVNHDLIIFLLMSFDCHIYSVWFHPFDWMCRSIFGSTICNQVSVHHKHNTVGISFWLFKCNFTTIYGMNEWKWSGYI